MSGKSFKVTAAYVTLRVDNELGQEVLLGFHQGATLPESTNQEDLDRHVRKGMVAEEGSPKADLLGVPAGTPVQESDDSRAARSRRSGARSADAKPTDEAKG